MFGGWGLRQGSHGGMRCSKDGNQNGGQGAAGMMIYAMGCLQQPETDAHCGIRFD